MPPRAAATVSDGQVGTGITEVNIAGKHLLDGHFRRLRLHFILKRHLGLLFLETWIFKLLLEPFEVGQFLVQFSLCLSGNLAGTLGQHGKRFKNVAGYRRNGVHVDTFDSHLSSCNEYGDLLNLRNGSLGFLVNRFLTLQPWTHRLSGVFHGRYTPHTATSNISAMRRLSLLLLPLLVLSMGCDAFSTDKSDTGGIVTLSGVVLNSETAAPIPGAFVRVLPMDLLFEADSQGAYSFEVEVDSTMDLTVQASLDGFASANTIVLALAGRTIQVPTISLVPTADAPKESGRAANMLLLSQSVPSIGVRESGSEEVATLTFQLADSVGRPVILTKAASVRFRFGARPGGGEEIAPLEATTDNNGQVQMHISSGTRAGVVQVIAETDVAGRTVRSQPVALTIHGGHPDQTHFSLGPVRRNFPGLNVTGLTNAMSVIVGDRYSNPVRTGTSVYFNTTHGVIGGSLQTDESGRGSVELTSANPLPLDGIAQITATTVDDTQAEVRATTPVVFSGTPVLTVTPGSAILNQSYTLTVTDYNGNPLVAGTSISVEAEGTAIKTAGNTDVTLSETAFSGGLNYEHVVRGPGITEFTFFVIEDTEAIDPENPVTPSVSAITITVSGENGNLEIVLGAGGQPALLVSDNAELSKTGSGYRVTVDRPIR